MIFRMVQIALAVGVALAAGTYVTWYSIRGADNFGAVTIGGWTAYPEAGTSVADPYAKARLARDASLSLGAAEGVTFFAGRDADGQILSGSCNYTIAGTSPSARIWTLFAVGTNQIPVKLTDTAWPTSVHSNSIIYENSGGFRIAVSAKARPDNWLAVQEGQVFILAFTLYDSPVATNKGLVETPFPSVKKVNCNA
jgi:hypothetical protein